MFQMEHFDTGYTLPFIQEQPDTAETLLEDIRYGAEPTPALFHASEAFVRGIKGPIGSGKSVACCAEVFKQANLMPPWRGIRKSRWAIVRNTFPELKTTTIKTWLDWFEDYTEMKYGSPIEGFVQYTHPDGDGTTVELELIFIALDLPKDVKKLKSLELTGIWFNEANEIRKSIIDMGTGRVGRYPQRHSDDFHYWSGVIMDTNAPDELSWWYEMAEEEKPDDWEFFNQPPAILRLADGRYAFNPKAENVSHQPLGAKYWIRQVAGKRPEWIKVFLTGEYGSLVDGKAVYAGQWSDTYHVAQVELWPIKNREIIIGLDFGLWPSAIIAQITPRGQLRIIEELCAEDMGVKQFAVDVLKPTLSSKYKNNPYIAIGDPAGGDRSPNDATSVFQLLASDEVGLVVQAAPDLTNQITKRHEAVRYFLGRMSGTGMAFQLSPTCKILRKGFNGGYHYRKLQVSGTEDRYQPKPEKNRFSHPHDALQYLCSYLTQDLDLADDAQGGAANIPAGADNIADTVAGY